MNVPGTGNFSNLHRILRSPDAAEGGIGASASSNGEGYEAVDASVMEVLNKRGLGMELAAPTAAEKAAAATKAKKEREANQWKDDEEGEEGEEGEEEEVKPQNTQNTQKEKGKEKEEEAEGPSAEEIAEATKEWKERIAELEHRAGEASTEEAKAELAEELETAKAALADWEEAAGGTKEAETPAAEIAQVKAELTKAQEEKAQLEQRVRELEAKGTPGLSVENIPPLFFTEKPEEIERMDQEFAEFEKWAFANWDGTEERTVEKNGKEVVVQPAYSKEQIRSRFAEISELRKNVIPAARRELAKQAQAREQAKTVYPELFDAKRPEGKAAENILRALPALKAMFPNVWVIIGDALVGERLRLEKAKKNGNANGKGLKGGLQTRRPLPRVARGAGAGTAGSGTVTGTREAKKKLIRANGGIDPEKFMEGGGDRRALIAAIT